MVAAAVKSLASPGLRRPLKIVLPSVTMFTSAARVACNFKVSEATSGLPAAADGTGGAAETMAGSELGGTAFSGNGSEEASTLALETAVECLCMYSVTRGTRHWMAAHPAAMTTMAKTTSTKIWRHWVSGSSGGSASTPGSGRPLVWSAYSATLLC